MTDESTKEPDHVHWPEIAPVLEEAMESIGTKTGWPCYYATSRSSRSAKSAARSVSARTRRVSASPVPWNACGFGSAAEASHAPPEPRRCPRSVRCQIDPAKPKGIRSASRADASYASLLSNHLGTTMASFKLPIAVGLLAGAAVLSPWDIVRSDQPKQSSPKLQHLSPLMSPCPGRR